MNDRHVRTLISAYLDHELDDEQKHEVEDHLYTCDQCLKEYKDILFIKEQLHFTYAEEAVPDHLENNILSAISVKSLKQPSVNRRERAYRSLPLVLILSAFAVLIIAFIPQLSTWYDLMSTFFSISFSMAYAAMVVINKLPIVMEVGIALLSIVILGSVWTLIKLLPSRSLFEDESSPSTR